MLIKIGNKDYCFARGGCKSNVDIITEALIKGAEMIKDPHVKAHKPQAVLRTLRAANDEPRNVGDIKL